MGIFSFLSRASGDEPNDKSSANPVETKQEEAQRHTKDKQTIKALRDAGSDLTRPHTLEHHFVTYERSKADAVLADKLAVGYKVSKISSLKDETGKTYWYFDLIKAVVPTDQNIFAESLRMTTLEKKYGVLYDGWGCEVEK
jgi:regulator of RNase E activity RraB